jgi:hypothetical protein
LLHQHRKIKKMKARITLIAAVLTLSANVLFASNDITPAPAASSSNTTTVLALNPTTPAEASFEDASIEMISPLSLAPATPAVAEFDDVVAGNVDNGTLAPTTPFEADFE